MPDPANRLVIALAQIPSIVGDIAGNRDRLRKARAEAAAFGADLVMAPELFLSGYPPEDLVLKPAFQEACRAALEDLARLTADGGPAALVGLPWVEDGKLFNAMALLDGGRIEAVRFKVDLPNYGVFDEKRVFAPGPSPGPIVFRGVRVGVPICEDIWGPDPVECILETGGEILLVANASPYERDKLAIRQNVAVSRVVESGLPLIYLNLVGGQDELVFEGASFALNADRGLAVQLPAFRPAVARTLWERGGKGWRCVEGPRETVEEGDEADYSACVMGLRDYVDNNRFPGVVLGLSGGVDSALSAAMAVDALGRERVAFRRRRLRRGARGAVRHRADRRAGRGRRPCARENVRRTPTRHHRREYPEPGARGDPDGDLQQDRRDGGDDRQQVGNVGRLCDPLRRHERRLQSDQGPLQDGGVPLVGIAQPLEAGWRAGAGRRGHPGEHSRQVAERRIAREPEGRGFAAALSRARRHPARARRKGNAPRRSHRRRVRPRHGAQGRKAPLSRRIQAPPVGAGRQGRAEEFRPRPALSDRQPVPRSRLAGAEARRLDRPAEIGGDERAVRGVIPILCKGGATEVASRPGRAMTERSAPGSRSAASPMNCAPFVAAPADCSECRFLFIERR